MIKISLVLLFLVVTASVIFYRSLDFLPFALGAVLGVSLNIVKIFILEHTTVKVLNIESKRAGNYIRIQHFLRFILTGLVLLMAALLPFINVWGSAVGVCTLQVAVFFIKRPANMSADTNKIVDNSTDNTFPAEATQEYTQAGGGST